MLHYFKLYFIYLYTKCFYGDTSFKLSIDIFHIIVILMVNESWSLCVLRWYVCRVYVYLKTMFTEKFDLS